jgi:hypothetical protein
MKRGIILTLFSTMLIAFPVLSKGTEVTREKRNVRDFTKVSFGVAGNLYISIGKEFSVELEGDKSLLDEIETEVSGGRLVIKKDNWRWNNNDKVTVYITMPELTGLGVSGSGKAEIKDPVTTGDLDLSVSGSGKLYTNTVDVDNLDCSISGSGDIYVGAEGTADNVEISISGSGGYSGDLLKIDSAEISISGSGNCSCNVTGSLEARVSGSGSVSYLGNPKIDARISGSGKVRSK